MEGIRHLGKVISIQGNQAMIILQSEAACQSCSAKGLCGIDEKDKKTFSLPAEELMDGDRVQLEISNQTAFHAMFMAYFLPFILSMIVLITSISFSVNEGLAGLYALLILPVYYMVLHFARPQSFQIKVQKL